MRSLTTLGFASLFASICVIAGCSSNDGGAAAAPGGEGPTNPPVTPNNTSNAPGGGAGAGVPSASKDLVDTAIQAGSFKTLVAAVQEAGLEPTLRGPGPFTVFAPTDAAFAKIPGFLLTELTSPPYKTELGLILKYHVLPEKVKAAAILGKTLAPVTVEGGSLAVDGKKGKVVINGNVDVITPDVGASNGVIHVIDGVLLPSIVDTAAGYDDGTNKFSTLVSVLESAQLVDTLQGSGPFTVFAPTDKAFANLKSALGDVAFNAILADKAKLTKILTYHVLSSAVYAKDVRDGAVATVETGTLALTAGRGKVRIGDATTTPATVILADLPNRNGVIHAIDKVLLPPGI